MKSTNAIFEKLTLGKTDIEVTPIGLGIMQFSGGKGFYRFMLPEVPQTEKNLIIKTALDGGINWFDTAELYGFGRSEKGLSDALKAARVRDDEVVVATKWNPFFRTAKNISKTIDQRIKYLGGYTIDLYMIHQPYGFSTPEAEMDAMVDLVESGKIRSIGVSNFGPESMLRAHAALEKRGLPLAVNQVQYSLIHRKIESNGILEVAKDLGVTIVAWSPLGSGLLTGKFHQQPEIFNKTPFGRRMQLRSKVEDCRPVVDLLLEIAADYDVTPGEVALNWLINIHGELVVAIPGASKVEQAELNARTMNFRLSESDIQRLDEATQRYR